jgi:hypothetical protein
MFQVRVFYVHHMGAAQKAAAARLPLRGLYGEKVLSVIL